MKRWMMHSAVTIIEPNGLINRIGQSEENDHEVCQFAAEFPMRSPIHPIPEATFRKAFREMEEACLQKAREAGLTRP